MSSRPSASRRKRHDLGDDDGRGSGRDQFGQCRGCSYVTGLATSLDCEADRRIRLSGRCYLHLDDPQETQTVWIALQQLHLGVLRNGLATVRGRFRRTGSKHTGSKYRGEFVAIRANGLIRSDAKMINRGSGCRGIRRRG